MKGILVIVAVLCGFLFGFGKLMDSAMADVTGAGATTNTQSTSGSSASNTAITGGYHSEATTNYQDGSSSNTTTNNTTTNNNNSYTGDQRTVPSASAPGISAMSQDLCTVGVSAGLQKPLIGASLGITKRDMNCERMKLSKLLFDFNMKVAAVSILCQDSRVFQSMAHAGTPCPFNGKIGDAALDEWNKYDKERPDYEEYVASLRYMEKVDNEILEELNEEPIIVDGDGNAVILGSQD
jgi:hypothetical protein|tara:strand:+ start:235 stop:948 length:714 start_codon:yes stop_codon:yes gene_type:complete